MLIQGASEINLREQGDCENDLGSTEINLRSSNKENLGSGEQRVKFRREQGAGDPPCRASMM